jgi:hypothetical protein
VQIIIKKYISDSLLVILKFINIKIVPSVNPVSTSDVIPNKKSKIIFNFLFVFSDFVISNEFRIV